MPSFTDHLEADYLVIANTLEHPKPSLSEEAFAIAMQVPWERDRPGPIC